MNLVNYKGIKMAKKLKNHLLDEDVFEKIKTVAKKVDKTESYLVNFILEKELDNYSVNEELINAQENKKRRRKSSK